MLRLTDPAFPHPDANYPGMTIREYAAIHLAASMARLSISYKQDPQYAAELTAKVAVQAVAQADALIRELNGGNVTEGKS